MKKSAAPARVLAWIGICSIIVLSVIPANERPVGSGVWLGETLGLLVDHIAAFSLMAGAFAIGYRFSVAQLVLMALCFCGGIELIQILLPTRHARVGDFVIDFVASCVAIAIVRGSEAVT
jgi:hypothetical protein